jgi:hypothetical protein
MANVAQQQALSHIFQSSAPPLPPSTTNTAMTQLVEAPVYVGPAQPTTGDLLRAIQDLGSKIHQLSKNQQALESKLDSVQKKVDAINYNVVAGATWLSAWDYYISMNMSTDGPTVFKVTGLNVPHWK